MDEPSDTGTGNGSHHEPAFKDLAFTEGLRPQDAVGPAEKIAVMAQTFGPGDTADDEDLLPVESADEQARPIAEEVLEVEGDEEGVRTADELVHQAEGEDGRASPADGTALQVEQAPGASELGTAAGEEALDAKTEALEPDAQAPTDVQEADLPLLSATEVSKAHDLQRGFLQLRASLPMVFIIAGGLMALTLLVLYHFSSQAKGTEEALARGLTLVLALSWLVMACLGGGHRMALAQARLARQGTVPDPLYRQVLLVILLLTLLLAATGLYLEQDRLLPLPLLLLLSIPVLVLLHLRQLDLHDRPPFLMLSVSAMLLLVGPWVGGQALTGEEQRLATGLSVLLGGALLVIATASLRQSHDALIAWTLGCLGLAGLLGLQARSGAFDEGSLISAGGGGALVMGGCLLYQWRERERTQRQMALVAGEQALAGERPVEALDRLETAFRLAARDGVLLQEPRYWALKGTALSSQRKYRRAMVYLGVALELDPTDEEVWFQRGKLYATLKRWEGAAESFTRAVSRQHDFLEAWLALGEAELQRGAHREALNAFTRVTKLAPRELKGWMGVGRSHAAMGQVRQAVQAFDTAIRLDPQALPPRKAKAKVYYTLKLWEKAEEAYEAVIQLDRNSSEGWWKLAGCYLELRQPQMALVALNSFLELKPDNVEGLLRRAAIHYDEGEYGEAISDVHLALDLDPESEAALQLKEIVLGRLKGSGGWR